MLDKNKYTMPLIIGHIFISVAIFIFFAIISGLFQLSYVLIENGWSLERAMSIINENNYYGIEIGSILGSYYSIILIFVIVEYFYKESSL